LRIIHGVVLGITFSIDESNSKTIRAANSFIALIDNSLHALSRPFVSDIVVNDERRQKQESLMIFATPLTSFESRPLSETELYSDSTLVA